MAQLAQSAVFVSCAAGATAEANATLPHVRGPSGPFINTLADTLACYPAMGFQASHFGDACRLARSMVTPQHPSKVFAVRDGAFVEIDEDGNVVPPTEASSTAADDEQRTREPMKGGPMTHTRVYPTLFCGMTANLLGTGCREALRFLVQEGVEPRRPHGLAVDASTSAAHEKTHIQKLIEREIGAFEPAIGADVNAIVFPPPPLPDYKSFLSAIVTSGGGVEHDIRRACEAYELGHYSSEGSVGIERETTAATTTTRASASTRTAHLNEDGGRFGNIAYGMQTTGAPQPLGPRGADTHSEGGQTRSGSSHTRAAPTTTTTDSPTPPTPSLFTLVMRQLVRRLMQHQALAFRTAQSLPIPDAYDDTCVWSITPSEVWCLAGLWLPSLIFESLCEQRGLDVNGGNPRRRSAEGIEQMDETGCGEQEELRQRCRAEACARAESTVVYWAACQEVPIFSPSFVDGDIMRYILEEADRLCAEHELHAAAPMDSTVDTIASSSHRAATSGEPLPDALRTLKLDIVRDVYYINKMAMMSKFTGIIVCGGGVVKHHICNANLMRNGADLSVFLNNGQEFDGSDGGARPEEAISWGKIRIDGQAVKMYSEVTAVFPLLVASVFVPAIRDRQS